MERFDLIVIGSGSGLDVANAAAEHGMKVAIIEKDRMGGTCLNRGCIPSKLLLHSADVMETIHNAYLFGIYVHEYSIDYPKIIERVNGIVDPESSEIRKAFDNIKNPRLFPVQCRFVGQKEIQAGDSVITSDKILIACGARPSIPKIEGLEGSGYITSTEALRLKIQPKVLTILGGGYIACELAHFFGSLGTKINIVQRRDFLLPNEDEDVYKKFTDIFSKKYHVYAGHQTYKIRKEGDTFHVLARDGKGKEADIESDQLLVAAGRTPNTDTLDLEKTGVKTNEKGYVIVDELLETSTRGIFALGDVIGRYQFKHSANHEAQYAFENIVHDKKMAVNYEAMPHAVFSSPQVAGVGRTEQDLRRNKIDYMRSVYPYSGSAMGQAIEDREGFVKLLVDRNTRKILGCHIMGTDASVLVHEVLVAMRSGGTIDALANTIFIHPALSEVVARAAYAVQ